MSLPYLMQIQARASLASVSKAIALSSHKPFRGSTIFATKDLSLSVVSPWPSVSHRPVNGKAKLISIGTSGVGQLVIGKLAPSLIAGPVVSLPNVGGDSSYAVIGDVTLNNTIVLMNQTIIMDVGTDNIQA
jgi:hypothetical protein